MGMRRSTVKGRLGQCKTEPVTLSSLTILTGESWGRAGEADGHHG